VTNKEVLHRVKEDRNMLHTIKRKKANFLRRNYFVIRVTEGKIEWKGRRGKRRKKLLDDLKEKKRYWNFKEEVLDRTAWRTCFGGGYGHTARQTTH
jgi:hypothetical protein